MQFAERALELAKFSVLQSMSPRFLVYWLVASGQGRAEEATVPRDMCSLQRTKDHPVEAGTF